MTRLFGKFCSTEPSTLDNVAVGIRRKALHVERTACNNCNLVFEDKYYDKEYSNNDAGRKRSEGTHLVECPYCGFVNARTYAHWDQIKERGQIRDYTADMAFGTRFGPKPPMPAHLTKPQVNKIASEETSWFRKLIKKV